MKLPLDIDRQEASEQPSKLEIIQEAPAVFRAQEERKGSKPVGCGSKSPDPNYEEPTGPYPLEQGSKTEKTLTQ